MSGGPGTLELEFSSALEGIAWPAVCDNYAASTLSVLQQLETSQWLAPDEIVALQLRQLDALLRHAHVTVPYYRHALRGVYDPSQPIGLDRFAALPLLKRAVLQADFEHLRSQQLPSGHGEIVEARTTGSTGTPVRVHKTQLSGLMWRAFAVRDHLWHRRDLGGKLAAIRYSDAEGDFDGWGPITDGLIKTGPGALLSVTRDVETQFSWLHHQQPDVLLTYPSIAAELARMSIESASRSGPGVSRLRELRTFGEMLPPQVRMLCRQAWDVPVRDVYSAEEIGYIALQCPEAEHYHVQSEGLLVEVLDEAGRACEAGEIGRVVVTPLHNFAMPLIRYEIGDYAEVGERCACGRGLPVLRRIMGRVRNMLVTASGQRYWPLFGSRFFDDIAKVNQYQFVQTELDLVEARLVVPAQLPAQQEARLQRHILSWLPSGFRLKIVYTDRIPRGAGGKFEDFISEVSVAARA